MSRYLQVDFLLAGLRDSSGRSLASGKVYTYEAGTTTAKALYTEVTGTTAHANPIILDARGSAQAFGNGAYKFVIKDSTDATQYTWDNQEYAKSEDSSIYSGTSTGAANAYAVTPSPAVTALVDGDIVTFIANHASTGAATLNVSGLGAKTFLRVDGSTALTAGDILSSQLVDARYVSASNHFRLVSQAGVAAIASGGTGASTAAAARVNLGLGTMATQAASAVAITGGTIDVVKSASSLVLDTTGANNIAIKINGTTKGEFATGGVGTSLLNPASDNNYTLGNTSPAFKNIYTHSLTLVDATSYPAGFTYTETRTLNPAVATAAQCADAWNTLVRDLVTAGILKP